MVSQKLRIVALTLLAPLLGLAAVLGGCRPVERPEADAKPDSYLFCFWNVENLFDDKDNNRKGPGDREYDPWFANDPKIRELKYSNLSKALVQLNDGKGPDILALAEVESVRAAELLQEALNKRLEDESLHYTSVLMKELTAGRHIAPAILTRLPVQSDRTRLHGRRQRILEGHVVVDGQDLVILATHWTSRIRQGGQQRAEYGDQIYGTFKAMYKRNPQVDVLICGDFNDTPQDESVTKHLHATGDLQAVRNSPADDPLLLNLLAGKSAEDGWGTHFDRGRWFIFDQIVVSPGMLDDAGWTCDPDSVKVEKVTANPHDKKGRPWRFGSKSDKHERGYSDHFPVTVRLKVHPK